MRLVGISIEVGFYAYERQLNPTHQSKLKNLQDVFEVFLERALKEKPLTGLPYRRLVILAATEKRSNYRTEERNVLRIGIAGKRNASIDRGMSSEEIYEHFMWLIEEAFLRESPVLVGYLPFLHRAYEKFRSDNYCMTWQLSRQKPRGQRNEFILEATLDEHALSVDFVCRCQNSEIYREHIMQTGPYPKTMFKGALKKVDFDGNRISISGRVPTKIPPSNLSMSKHGDVKKYDELRLSHYNWSRELELVLGCPGSQ